MKIKFWLFAVVACLVMAWTMPAAQAFWVVTRTMMEEERVTETDLIPMVDNFIILFDTSGSTNEMVPGKSVSKIQAVKSLLRERNTWFPDLGYNVGLYIYTDDATLMGTFKEVYPVKPYDRTQFAAAIDQLPDRGRGATFLQAGLSPLRKVLADLSGETAIIMFTDGKIQRARGTKRPLDIARDIAAEHDVCFYLISSATEDVEKQLVEGVSTVNACSRVVPLELFLDNPHYLSGALFTIKTTAYTRLRPVTKLVGFIAEDMLFDFDSPGIRDAYYEKLGLLGDFLQNNPDAYVVAGGYTDSVGDPEYNLALSERRAESVKTHLVDRFGIDPDRIVTLWFGEEFPVADNGTADGRQLNRRVQVAIGGVD